MYKRQLIDFSPDFTIINASSVFNENFKEYGMNSETFIIFHMGKRIAIIGGTEYGGEMKKGIFSVLHYLLPLKGVLSMHCSANVDEDGKNSAIFFGLSGTGKTTLSTDPKRPLIGDDEHGWSDDGIFNFEGGCYAKTINLNPENEPDIFKAIRRGALLENVVYDNNSRVNEFDDATKTENTRVSYPLDHIDNSLFSKGFDSISGHPENIIFLTCDAFGVLPPIAKLSSDQAMYHFINGYTAKVAGTEKGVTEPSPTFSPCYGGPFLPLHPRRYAEMLGERIDRHKVSVWFINTGWTGGGYGVGERMPIHYTRAIVNAALDGKLASAPTNTDPTFGFEVPMECPGVPAELLNPRNTWDDKQAYDQQAQQLARQFEDNFSKYADDVSAEVRAAGPSIST